MNAVPSSNRVAAIDVFRAITMLMMLWVNDFAGLREIPHWLEHAGRGEDMMGFSDTVFPAFLFIMGMSVPFAIRSRLAKGDPLLKVALHIVLRTVALLVMGLFTVNYESIDAVATGLPRAWFAIAMTVAFFLIWAVYPKTEVEWRRGLFIGLQVVGAGILVWLFAIYAGRGDSGFGVRWWGILGLIGWTYIVSAAVYLLVRDRVVWNFVAWGLIVAYCILNSAGIIPNFIRGGVTLYAFGISGLLSSSLMKRYATAVSPWKFFGWLAGIAAVMAVAGFVAHNFWIISKNQATPTWLFFCLAMFLPLFGLIYWLTETKGKAAWFRVIAPAGTVTLTCYVIPYVWYSVRSLLHLHRPELLQSGALGLVGSIVFALLVVALAGLMNRYLNVKLKI